MILNEILSYVAVFMIECYQYYMVTQGNTFELLLSTRTRMHATPHVGSSLHPHPANRSGRSSNPFHAKIHEDSGLMHIILQDLVYLQQFLLYFRVF